MAAMRPRAEGIAPMKDLRERVEAALAEVRPVLQADGGDVHLVRIEGDTAFVAFAGACGTCPSATATLQEVVGRAVQAQCPEIRAVRLAAGHAPAPEPHAHAHARSLPSPRPIDGVGAVVAVASGKGGVGKTMVAVNLALALAARGKKVGLLDADIYGPNVATMLGAASAPDLVGDRMLPAYAHGLAVMSIAYLVDPEAAVIWRGPLVTRAIQQFLRDVEWGELDVLVIDLPPGTGDVQITVAQEVQIDGAIIVTTPSELALADVRRGLRMFEKVRVPVIGVVENMAYFLCPHCNGRTDVFSHGGGRAMAEKAQLPLLAEIPLDPALRAAGDDGRPLVVNRSESLSCRPFLDLAGQVVDYLASTPTQPRASA